jgi:hypothetical protein
MWWTGIFLLAYHHTTTTVTTTTTTTTAVPCSFMHVSQTKCFLDMFTESVTTFLAHPHMDSSVPADHD